MDTVALNYNPEATVQSDGSCLYGGTGPITDGSGCSASAPYRCDYSNCESTLSSTPGYNLQWVDCEVQAQYGQVCDSSTRTDGQCNQPCTPQNTGSCFTESDCLSVATCREEILPGHACTNYSTHWYLPPPYSHGSDMPPPPPPPGRCEHSCSVDSRYTCRDESSCTAIGKQWVEGIQYLPCTIILIVILNWVEFYHTNTL
jgi:hypothetical protein